MNRNLFLIVWLMALWGAVAIIPYSLTTQADALSGATASMPLPILILLSLVQSGVLLALLTGAGLFLAPRSGLSLPFLTALADRRPIAPGWGGTLLRAALIGAGAALAIFGLERLLFMPAMATQGLAFPEQVPTPVWQRFLASFYGGITEEVIVRLFLMTLLVWLGAKVSRGATGKPKAGVYWIAIIIAALVFGLGHLPVTAAMGLPLNGLIVTRALVLNGVAGFVFGWLYWQRGLESAMAAHFTADLLLLILLPLFL